MGVPRWHRLGLVCALALSIIADGYRPVWDSDMGPPSPVTLPYLQAAVKEAAFAREAIAKGIAAGVMRPGQRDTLTCILPLHVA
jgi:hypothetical protein